MPSARLTRPFRLEDGVSTGEISSFGSCHLQLLLMSRSRKYLLVSRTFAHLSDPHSPFCTSAHASGYPYGGNAGCRANTPDRVSSTTFSPPVPLSTQVSFSETLSTRLTAPDTAADGSVLAPIYEVEADYICESIIMCDCV